MTFTKLFSSITASTIWCESSDTRVVWITMLAMSDRYGRVWASIPGLAKEAAVSVEACRAAVHAFLSPDPDSRTKVAEGRRIEPIDGGWKLINHAKYRAIRDEEERRAYKTEKQRQYRSVDNLVDNVDKSGPKLNVVDPGGHNAEAEADTDTKKEQKPSRAKAARGANKPKEIKHSTDPRHVACKAEIFAYYQDHNGGADPDWDGWEGRALGMLLNANPKLTADGIKRLLASRGHSDVNHSIRPCKWIPLLSSYRNGPIDKFGNTISSNGAVNGKSEPTAYDLKVQEFMAERRAHD